MIGFIWEVFSSHQLCFFSRGRDNEPERTAIEIAPPCRSKQFLGCQTIDTLSQKDRRPRLCSVMENNCQEAIHVEKHW